MPKRNLFAEPLEYADKPGYLRITYELVTVYVRTTYTDYLFKGADAVANAVDYADESGGEIMTWPSKDTRPVVVRRRRSVRMVGLSAGRGRKTV